MKLYKSDNLDNPINTVSLGQSLFFHFPPLDRDGEVSAFNFIFCLNLIECNCSSSNDPAHAVFISTVTSVCFSELCADAVLHAVPLPVRLHSAPGLLHLHWLPQARHSHLQPHCKMQKEFFKFYYKTCHNID